MGLNTKQLEDRINRLRPSRLVVLARCPDGTTKEMSAPKCVETGADFIRVVRGSDLRDVNLLLNMIQSVID